MTWGCFLLYNVDVQERSRDMKADYKLVLDVRNGEVPFDEAVKQYNELLWKKVHKWHIKGYDNDDLYSLAMFALYKAVQSFNGEGTLVAYAGFCIDNELGSLLRKTTSEKGGEETYEKSIRLNAPVRGVDGGLVELGGLLASPTSPYKEIFTEDLMKNIHECLEEMGETEKRYILWSLYSGEQQKDLVKRENLTQGVVSRRLKRYHTKLATMLAQHGIDSNYLK